MGPCCLFSNDALRSISSMSTKLHVSLTTGHMRHHPLAGRPCKGRKWPLVWEQKDQFGNVIVRLHLQVRAGLAVQRGNSVQVPTQVYPCVLHAHTAANVDTLDDMLLQVLATVSGCGAHTDCSVASIHRIACHEFGGRKGVHLQADARLLHCLKSLPCARGVAADHEICHPAQVCQLLCHLA